jgi:hypothetical protein
MNMMMMMMKMIMMMMTFRLEECDKEENTAVTGAATASCLNRRV